MSRDIQFVFHNNSDSTADLEVVLSHTQRNGDGGDQDEVAWLVIRHCGPGQSHAFVYPQAQGVACVDAYGNYTAQLDAHAGDVFALRAGKEGSVALEKIGTQEGGGGIEVRNECATGAIKAVILKDARALAESDEFPPAAKVNFQLKPQLYISAGTRSVADRQEQRGWEMTESSEISLLGIEKADIIMTGGGQGRSAKPITFTLENIVYA